MNNKTLIGIVVAVALVAGVVGGYAVNKLSSNQLLGGDFAGGITPSQLFSASTVTNSVTPILSNLFVSGAVSAGGTAASNQVTTLYTATTSYPSAAVTLGGYQSTTSTTSTNISFNASGFSVGDACEIAYNSAPTSTPFGEDGI